MRTPIKSTLRATQTYKIAEIPDPEAWLVAHAFADELLLLAHTDDGVIWGRLNNGCLTTADIEFPDHHFAGLRPSTLQTCRLFGMDGELMLWRTGEGWAARCWRDGRGDTSVEYFDEDQILWGTQIEAATDSFTLVSDGINGLLHAVPLAGIASRFSNPAAADKRRPLRLTLRHYLVEDDADGVVAINGSRLVHLFASGVTGRKEA